jgi:hypothetical protein
MAEMPQHPHTFTQNSCVANAAANASTGDPTGAYWANDGKANYSTPDPNNPIVTERCTRRR